MANFGHGHSARTWKRPRSRRRYTAHDPNTPERKPRKQFLPIAYCMANFAGNFCRGTRLRRARSKCHSTPHSEEKNFTNRIFPGEQCRRLAIYAKLLSLFLKLNCKVRLWWYPCASLRVSWQFDTPWLTHSTDCLHTA